MKTARNFRDYKVWQDAVAYATEVYKVTAALPYFEFVYDHHWDLGHGWSGDMPK